MVALDSASRLQEGAGVKDAEAQGSTQAVVTASLFFRQGRRVGPGRLKTSVARKHLTVL